MTASPSPVSGSMPAPVRINSGVRKGKLIAESQSGPPSPVGGGGLALTGRCGGLVCAPDLAAQESFGLGWLSVLILNIMLFDGYFG